MVKREYEFTITQAPVTHDNPCEVPVEIQRAAAEQGIELLAFSDSLTGHLQLATNVQGELVLVLVRVRSEREPIQKGEDLRQEIQKLLFI
jgi:hypothetical protein